MSPTQWYHGLAILKIKNKTIRIWRLQLFEYKWDTLGVVGNCSTQI